MAPKHQRLYAPPSSNKFDRVLNWCERDVKNFYELCPTRVDSHKGVRTNAVENRRIDSHSLSKPDFPGMPDTIFSTNLAVY